MFRPPALFPCWPRRRGTRGTRGTRGVVARPGFMDIKLSPFFIFVVAEYHFHFKYHLATPKSLNQGLGVVVATTVLLLVVIIFVVCANCGWCLSETSAWFQTWVRNPIFFVPGSLLLHPSPQTCCPQRFRFVGTFPIVITVRNLLKLRQVVAQLWRHGQTQRLHDFAYENPSAFVGKKKDTPRNNLI